MGRKSAHAYTLEDQQALISGQFVFDSALPVTSRSQFGDSQWNWFDRTNFRFQFVPESKLCVDWPYTAVRHLEVSRRRKRARKSPRPIPPLPPDLIEDVKRAFYLIAKFP